MDSISLLLVFYTRHRLRSAMTFAVLALAFGLLGCVDAVRVAFSPSVGESDKRLVIASAYSVSEGLPARLAVDLQRQFPDLTTMAWASWVGGYDRTKSAPVLNIAVSDNYFDAYPEYRIDADARAAFLQKSDAAIVGKRLASAKGWRVGQRVALRGVPFVNRASGATEWEYEIVGLFEVADDSLRGLESQFFSRWEWLQASAAYAHAQAGWLIAAARDAGTAQRVAPAIDGTTRDSRAPTRTKTEDAFQKQFANGIVDVAAICRIVTIVSLLLLWLAMSKNTNSAAKERARDFGALKNRGFHNGALFAMIVVETVVVVVGAAAFGMALATILLAAFGDRPDAEAVLLPPSRNAWRIFLLAAVALSLLASFRPAFNIARASGQHLRDGDL